MNAENLSNACSRDDSVPATVMVGFGVVIGMVSGTESLDEAEQHSPISAVFAH